VVICPAVTQRFAATQQVSSAVQQSAPKRYPINLDAPDRVGSRYQLVASSRQRQTATTTVHGQYAQTTTDEFAVELTADVLTEAVEKNSATRKRFIILNSKITKNGVSRPLLPEGTVVVASRAGEKTVFHTNEKLLDEQTTTWLGSLILLRTGDVGDDGMFGTKTPKAVGESWSISIDEVKKLLKEMGAPSETVRISGTGTLEKVGGNHLFIRGSVDVNDVMLPMPENFTAENGSFVTDYYGRLPLTEADPSRGVSSRLHLVAKGIRKGDPGPIRVEFVMDGESKYEIRSTAESTRPMNPQVI
jgi:hypothetical protein